MRNISHGSFAGGGCRTGKRLIAAAIAQALVVSVQAATITVDNAGDVSSPTHCTLRDAVSSSNRDAPAGGCITGSGADTIVLDPSISGQTIVLTQGHITLKDSVTIAGLGADQSTISGNLQSRIFKLNSYVPATISQLTLTSGSASSGGAIYSSGSLNIVDSVVSGNTASGSGGAIYSYYGDVTLTRTTISENLAGGRGGGIYSYYNGIAMSNSTLSSNSANTAGAISNYGNLVISQSTIASNTANTGAAGIDSLGELTLTNSIVAGSSGGADCAHGGSVTVNQNNLIEDQTCSAGAVNRLYGDPGLSLLSDNGNGIPSHALSAGSQAIDGGSMLLCEAVDQSGLPRPLDGDGDGIQNCDLGAFEFVDIVAPTALLDTAPDVIAVTNDDYRFSIAVSDDVRVSVGAFDSSDIQVTGPGGFSVTGTLLNTSPSANAPDIVAEYSFTPPFGGWEPADNGLYEVRLNSNELQDMADPTPNIAPGGVLGSFTVAIADIQVSGNETEIANGDGSPAADDGTDFGTVIVGSSRSRMFRIANAGAGTLRLTSPASVLGEAFTVSIQPASSGLDAGASTLLGIQFSPTEAGTQNATVTLESDDSVDGTFSFSVGGSGTAIATAPVVDNASVTITDAAPNDASVITLAVSDAEDNVPLTGAYAITSGNSDDVFRIDDAGRILVNRETLLSGSYTLAVAVTDATDLVGTGEISISVTPGDLLFRSRLE